MVKRLGTLVGGLLAAGALLGSASVLACVEGEVRGEPINPERNVGALAQGEGASMQIVGAGWFHAAEIVKTGRSSDATYVTIELDGEPLMRTSFATLKNKWMQSGNAFLIADVRSEGDVDTMTIWYRPDVKFNMVATVRVDVDEEGVDDIVLRSVLSRALPHSHPNGQPTATAALPAFK